MRNVFHQTHTEIEETQVLRNIIDYQFEAYTFKYFVGLVLIFLTTYLIPFLIQIFSANWGVVFACNLSCIISQMFFCTIELVQIKDGGKDYLQETWNRIEISMFFINSIYFVVRLMNLNSSFSPLYSEVASDSPVYVPMILMNFLLTIFAIMRMMYYLRAFESFGQIVQLMQTCLYDIQTFTIFLVMWFGTFTIIYLIIGLEVDEGDYKNMNRFFRTFIQVYRNSIGDLSPPVY